ncbi:MAG: TonB-dependent receptor [Pseudomonadota bacterium]
MNKLKLALLSTAAAGMLAPFGAAIAQTDDTILITARKKSEDLQDVPLSVAVTQGEDLRANVVTDLGDFTDSNPAVTVARTPTADVLYIRGIGSGNSVGFQQSVGTFVDGVYRGRGVAARTAFLDLERIEILKGPQPVYFGNSTIGGAFNIVSKGPSDELEANLTSSYEFIADEWVTELGIGGPISENFGFRIAYNHTESDGWMNDTAQNERTPVVNNDSLRATLAFTPEGNFDATLKVEYSDNVEEGGRLQVLNCNPILQSMPSDFGPSCNPGVFFAPGFEDEFDTNLTRGGTFTNGLEQVDINELQIVNGSFAMNYDITDDITITSVTGLVDYDNTRRFDVDSSPIAFAFGNRIEDYRQWSQEVRVQSSGDSPLTYMFGIYYENADFGYGNRSFNQTTMGPLVAGAQTRGIFNQDQRTIALFGSANYEITDSLHLYFGARWTDVQTDALKEQFILTLDGDPAPPGLIAAISNPLSPNPNDEHNLPGSRSDSDFNPAVEIKYYPTDGIMLYASYKEAFKTGGFDPNIQLDELALPTPDDANGGFEFDEETVKAWEVGAKTELFDNALTLNIAAFRTTFTDLQEQIYDVASAAFITSNVGEARSQGVEAEAVWRAMPGLSFNANLTYLDATYVDFANAACNGAQSAAFTPMFAGDQCRTNIGGQNTTFAPDISGTVGYDFSMPITNNLEAVSSGRVSFTSEFAVLANPEPEEIQGSFAKVDVRAGIAGNDGQWELAFVGKNLTDELTFRFRGPLPGNVGEFALADRGRELGIQARINY